MASILEGFVEQNFYFFYLHEIYNRFREITEDSEKNSIWLIGRYVNQNDMHKDN